MKALPSVLIDWHRAIIDFLTAYMSLKDVISQANQWPGEEKGVLRPRTQYSVGDLEKVREETTQELSLLTEEVNSPMAFTQGDIPFMIEASLRIHTEQLQKQTKRIQAALWLSSCIAS